MAGSYFSVPIFFIIFRETVEGAIIVSVLLSFVEQLMTTGKLSTASPISNTNLNETHAEIDADRDREYSETNPLLRRDQVRNETGPLEGAEAEERMQKLVSRMKIQIWAGMGCGMLIASGIGAAFIAVFYLEMGNLWSETEQIWEGVFSGIASVLIFIMGIAFLKMDRSRIKWRYKLAVAFEKSHSGSLKDGEEAESQGGKWALFMLPFVTVLREGLEAVVFVGGVSLQQPASSIPLATLAGLISGGIVGWLIYRTGSTTTLHWFLVSSTCLLFLIGAGLASKAVGFFEYYSFSRAVGGDVAETGDGPGSFKVQGNMWHFTWGNPEPGSASTNGAYQLLNSIFGWNNTATRGTISIYILYWVAIITNLIYLKWKEGRIEIFGHHSKAGRIRLQRQTQTQEGFRRISGDSDDSR